MATTEQEHAALLEWKRRALTAEWQAAQAKAALLASQQCITDFLDLYERGTSMQTLDEGAKSMKNDALRMVNLVLKKWDNPRP